MRLKHRHQPPPPPRKKKPVIAAKRNILGPHLRKRFDVAAAQFNRGEYQAAGRIYQQALVEFPEQWACYLNLGQIYRHIPDRLTQQLQLLQWAVIAGGDHPRALNAQGDGFCRIDDLPQAVAKYRQSLAREPLQKPAFFKAFGNVLFQTGAHHAALTAFARGSELAPDDIDFEINRSHALNGLGKHREAFDVCRSALTKFADPASAPIALRVGHATALICLGECAKADALIEAWSSEEQAMINTITLQARSSMLQGQFKKGWPLLDPVWRETLGPRAKFPGKIWQDEDLNGKTIVLFCEQGMGDTLQFVRYAPMVAALGAKVYLYCQVPLKRILMKIPGVHTVYGQGEILPHVDFNFALPSLANKFQTELHSIPAKAPYIPMPKPQRRTDKTLRIALTWAGNDALQNDHNRSLNFQQLLPLFDLSHCRFYNFQVGPKSTQIEASGLQHLVIQPTPFSDFSDTAEALQNIDLLITVDTSVAHLAGAIGTPVWTLLPHAPDWRWMLNRDDSPWYPSMRLFRQPEGGAWEPVIAAVKAALHQEIEQRTA